MNNEAKRACIFYDFKSDLKPDHSHQELKNAFAESAPSLVTIYCWFLEFNRGKTFLKGEEKKVSFN